MEGSDERASGASAEAFDCSFLLPGRDAVCMEHPEDMLKPWKTNPLFFEIVVVHAITFVFGLCGNAVVVGVLSRDGRARSATNSFLVSLAAGDLLMLCVYGPLETYSHFVVAWDEAGTVCRAAKFSEFLSAIASVLNLLAVTVERFLVIVFPMKSRRLCTSGNTSKAIVGVWLSSIVLTCPVVFATGTSKVVFTNNVTSITVNYCNRSAGSSFFAIYQFIVVFLLPGSVMVVCYAFVIRELWASTRKMKILGNGAGENWKSGRVCRDGRASRAGVKTPERSGCVVANREEVSAARKQVIKMLVLVVALFHASWGPRLTMDVLQKLGAVPFTQGAYLLRILFNLVTFFHGCVNPFVYSFMSRNFRRSLSGYLRRLGCAKPSEPGGDPRRRVRGPRRGPRPSACPSAGADEFKFSPSSFASATGTRSSEVESAALCGA